VFQVQFDFSMGVDALEPLKELKQLEEFHFSFWDDSDEFYSVIDEKNKATELIYSWCGQNLPKLKLIAGAFEDCLCAMEECRKFKSLVHNMSPKFSGVSDLETLHAEGKLPEASLPKLKKLIYYGTEMDAAVNLLSTLSSYQNLTHLGLKEIEWRPLVLILEHVGGQLSHLFFDLDVEAKSIDHYQLFHLCPNLVHYQHPITNNSVLRSPFKSRLSSHNFRNLQECKIAKVSADLFEMICQAPWIKSIEFYDFRVSKEHRLAVDSSDGFLHLEKFSLTDLRGLANDCSMKDFEEMVKKIVCSAPKLKDIDVTWTDESNCRDKWENSGAIKFIKLIEKHTVRSSASSDPDRWRWW